MSSGEGVEVLAEEEIGRREEQLRGEGKAQKIGTRGKRRGENMLNTRDEREDTLLR